MRGKALKKRHLLEEIALRMLVMDGPPIIHQHIEEREENNKETSRPLGLETDCNHNARGKTDEGEDYTCKVPFSLKSYSNEQED